MFYTKLDQTPAFSRKCRSWSLALLTSTMLIGCGGDRYTSPEPAPVTPQALDLTILHINDHHSHLDSREKTLKLRNASGERVAVTVDAGGFPRVTAAFQALAGSADHVLK